VGFHRRILVEEAERQLPGTVLFRKLLGELAPYKYGVIATVALIVINTMANLGGPYLTKIAIDNYIVRGDFPGLLWVSAMFLLLVMVGWITDAARSYLLSWVGQNFVNRLRNRLFSHILSQSYGFFSKHREGDLISRVINDTSVIQDVFISGLITTISDLFSLVGIIAVMLYMSVPLTLASFVTIPVLAAVSYTFSRKIRRAFRMARERIASVTTRVQESVEGARDIQAFTMEDRMAKSFDKASQQAYQADLMAAKTIAFFIPVVQFVGALGTCIVLWYGGLLVSLKGLTIGTLVAFLNYVSRFFRPILNLMWFYGNVQSALAAADRIFYVLDYEPEIRDAPDAAELPKVKGDIAYRDVTFGYEPGRPVLKGFNLRIKPSEKVAIVGPSGAGKTTLVNLLCRFYDVWSGSVAVDGYDVRRVTQKSLRRQIGVVPQETFLFPTTVRENIKVGNPEASDEEVEEICKELGIDGFIKGLPEGYETEVGEHGLRLSAGQRQLISFARVMLKDPAILVLDEAMSNVDPYTETLLRRAIAKVMSGRTTIIIAHRLSMARLADRIVVMDGGRIVEEGSHEELMARKGLYSTSYTRPR